MALSESEILELSRLLNKLEWPLDRRVFHSLIGKVVSVPQELIVLDDQNRILTFYRKDEEYNGFHYPGTVLRDNETVTQALQRLLEKELPDIKLESLNNIGWVEIPRGFQDGNNPTRHEVSLLWLARVRDYDNAEAVFFPLDQLPEDTLPHHKLIAQKVWGHLRTGEIILG